MIVFLRTVFKWFAALAVAYFLLGCFVLLFVGGMVAALQQQPLRIEDNSIAVLDLSVGIPDSPGSSDPVKLVEDLLSGKGEQRLALWDALEAIRKAADDPRITALHLRGSLGPMGGSLASLRELRAQIDAFKASGKKVIGYIEFDGVRELYVKSVADELYMSPSGAVIFKGLAVERMYLGDALQRFGIGVQVVSAGRYKSAADTFIRSDMSEPDREQMQRLIDSLWARVSDETAAALGVERSVLDTLAEGEMMLRPQDMQDAGLVDGLRTPSEMREALIAISALDADGESFRSVDLARYSEETRGSGIVGGGESGDAGVAIIYAEGVIGLGEGGDGVIGAHDLVDRLRELREDEDVAAVVLRVNSPGGGVFASDMIYREVQRLAAKKPVVVSMGGVAASGGYYIACGADTFFADPLTVTGSIGVVGMYPNLEQLGNRHGVFWDGVKTTRFSDSWTIARPKNEVELREIKEFIDDEYNNFVGLVADARGMDTDEAARLAEGRVWSGSDAAERGLIDRMGGLRAAVAAAAEKAGLDGNYRVIQSPRSLPLRDRIMEMLEAVAPIRVAAGAVASPAGPAGRYYERALHRAETLLQIEDPRGAYALSPFFLDID